MIVEAERDYDNVEDEEDDIEKEEDDAKSFKATEPERYYALTGSVP